MDNELKLIKYPLVYFLKKIKEKSKITDNDFRLLFVKIITYHQDYFLDLNIVPLFTELKQSHPQTWKIIKVYQKVIKNNLENFKNIRIYRNKISKRVFKMSLENQILNWENKYNKILALDDSSFGSSFSLRILLHNKNNLIYENEMIHRLIKIKKILGFNFFKNNNIVLFYLDDFLNFSWNIKTKIFFKLFKKVKSILKEDIHLLKKTKNYLSILNEIYQII